MSHPRAKLARARAAAVVVFAMGACSPDAPSSEQGGGGGNPASGTAGMPPSGGSFSAASGAELGGSATAGNAGASTPDAGSAGSGGASSNGGSSGQAGQAGQGGDGETHGPFTLSSSAFSEAQLIDSKFRCSGDNVTPPLSWTSGPAGTQSYAVTLIHVGSQSVHWLLWDIEPDARMLPEAITREAAPTTPAGSQQNKPNIDGSTWYGYTGPCPGSANQSYAFSVYALDVRSLPGINSASSSAEANAAVKAHQLAVAHLTGMASKQ